MKKIFSFVLLTGMLTLMSFGISQKFYKVDSSTISSKNVQGNCFDVCDALASAFGSYYNWSYQSEYGYFISCYYEGGCQEL